MRASFEASRDRSRPRIRRDLLVEQERVSGKRIGRLKQEEGLVARARKRFKVTTKSVNGGD